MPGASDKIIINSKGNRGMARLIASDLEALNYLGGELLEHDMLKETLDCRDALRAACDEHYAAQMKYHQFCRKLIADLASRIDVKLGLTP